MGDSFDFDAVEHFTAGTVGPPGNRVFYLQFGNRGNLVSLKAEKGQIHALAEFLDQLLEGMAKVENDDIPLALDLIEPIEAMWAISSIGVAFQEDDGAFVLVIDELTEEEEDGNAAEVHISPGQARAYIDRARDLVASGRPPCEYCGRPLDDDDGWCPCHN